jgi:hypothetical protein
MVPLFVLVFIAIIGFFSPIFARQFDNKDRVAAMEPIKKASKFGLIKTISVITKEDVESIKYRQDQIFAYQLRNKSLFSHLNNAMHPFFSIFTHFDARDSRISRFGSFFM